MLQLTNKDLTPLERVVFVREKGEVRQASIRIGNKVYAQWIQMSDFKTDIEWTAACARIIQACRQSASFFEAFGFDYFDATSDDLRDRHYKIREYPVKYIKQF